VGLLMYGALIEACQYLLPYRKAEIGDLMADIAGIAFGVLLASLGAGGWSMRLERWMRG
jgi:VanZ family protein